ncbi:hypothetical protein E2542_SST26393 [Spatholobus suberectus]|nr:hypothetical protein E2542_SST26393 [Spatholobus suberectus]
MNTISKALSSKNMTSECDSSEESGWTEYFEDFFDNHNIDDQKCSLSFSGVDSYSTSFISDAASLAATKKLTDSAESEEYGNGSSFKKRKKIKEALVDEALEDTASSPIKGSKEKGNTSGKRDERKELGFNGRDSEHTELKKE